MGLWTNEPLIKRSEVLGWDRCGSCVTKAVKPYQSDFTPLSGTKGRGLSWPQVEFAMPHQGLASGRPVVGDRHDPLRFVDGSMDAGWATSCPRSGASVRPAAPPEQVAGRVHERREQGPQLGPSRRRVAENQVRDWGGPRSVATDASSARTRPSRLRGWRGGHIPTSTGLSYEELQPSRTRGILVGGWALGLLRWTDEVGGW